MRAVQSRESYMSPEFTVSGRIAKPVQEVFEAVVDPVRLSGYFTTGGAKGRLAVGAEVTWDFHDFPGAFPVHVIELVPNEKIVLQWESADGASDAAGSYNTTVTMTFKPLEDDRTLVSIHEAGWRDTAAGQKASYNNCEGWTGMLAAMKVYLEHGINLREGFYK